MQKFREEIERRRQERRSRKSIILGGLAAKIAAFILLVLLIKFMSGPRAKELGNYLRELIIQPSSEQVVTE